MFVCTPTMTYSLQRALHAFDRQGAVLSPADQLGEHRVVEVRDLDAAEDRAVDAHAGPARLR